MLDRTDDLQVAPSLTAITDISSRSRARQTT
jgi:hypothetical protein